LNYFEFNYRDVARGMRDASPNSFAKKFATVTEAKNYIKGFNFKIVQNAKSMNVVSGDKGVKRKKIKEDQNNSVISSVKEFSEKVIFHVKLNFHLTFINYQLFAHLKRFCRSIFHTFVYIMFIHVIYILNS
jgi:hypothetical protein